MGEINWIAVVLTGVGINIFGLLLGVLTARFIVWVRNRLYDS